MGCRDVRLNFTNSPCCTVTTWKRCVKCRHTQNKYVCIRLYVAATYSVVYLQHVCCRQNVNPYVLVAGYSPYSAKKVAFFAGLTENFGPVTEHTDIIFDRVITNIGGGYEQKTGRFTAPYDGVYQFNVIVSAQGRQKVTTNGRRYIGFL